MIGLAFVNYSSIIIMTFPLLSLPVPFALQSIVIYINMAVLVQQNALLAHLYECLPISLHHYLHRLLACKKVC